MFRSRDLWKVNSKDHAVAASSSDVHAGDDLDDRATPLSGTQLRAALVPRPRSRSSTRPAPSRQRLGVLWARGEDASSRLVTYLEKPPS